MKVTQLRKMLATEERALKKRLRCAQGAVAANPKNEQARECAKENSRKLAGLKHLKITHRHD